MIVQSHEPSKQKIVEAYKLENLNDRSNKNNNKDKQGRTKPWTDEDFRAVVKKVSAQVKTRDTFAQRSQIPILFTQFRDQKTDVMTNAERQTQLKNIKEYMGYMESFIEDQVRLVNLEQTKETINKIQNANTH